MPFDGVHTAFYEIGEGEEKKDFAQSFASSFLAPFSHQNPVAIAAYGVPHAGKTTFCKLVMPSVVGRKAAEAMVNDGFCIGMRSGAVLRHTNFGRQLIGQEYDESDMEWRMLSENGMSPRANTGRAGIDWVEHATLPHIARADIILMFAKMKRQDNPEYYGHFSNAMRTALAHASEEIAGCSRLRQKLHNICPLRRNLSNHVHWNSELTKLVSEEVIPQMDRMVAITKNRKPLAPNTERVNIMGIIVVPHIPQMRSAAAGFHDACHRYAL